MKGWSVLPMAVLLAGCAGMDVKHVRFDPNAAFGPPEAFHVEDFAYDRAFKDQAAEMQDREEYLASFQNLTRTLSGRLRTELMDMAPVYVLKPTDPLPDKGYIIKGSMRVLEAGSPAARVFAGMGAGQTRFVCDVRMYRAVSEDQRTTPGSGAKDVKKSMANARFWDQPILAFSVSGGSKINSYMAVWEHQLKDDVEAAARKIAWQIREHLGYERN